MGYRQAGGFGEIFQCHVAVNIVTHVLDTLDNAILLGMLPGRKHGQAKRTQEAVKTTIRIDQVFNIFQQLEVMEDVVELGDPPHEWLGFSRRKIIFPHQVLQNAGRLDACKESPVDAPWIFVQRF